MLTQLTVKEEVTPPGYTRGKFPHWITQSGTCVVTALRRLWHWLTEPTAGELPDAPPATPLNPRA
ncbi:hypothetical protein [Streptomyces sp. 35G-GA-8]|uniref:hypothetical protein n=1 Tax=Streptomyces sp. 35G-GA-8 TaxID=2939434 RepID=UPI00201E9BB4|nr:hypothetical protein [Streptomyces sp. 35G-GA-8]MCL7382120.1 hypothetical protein [Streptomyces sp. 35G-GA-8]